MMHHRAKDKHVISILGRCGLLRRYLEGIWLRDLKVGLCDCQGPADIRSDTEDFRHPEVLSTASPKVKGETTKMSMSL